MSARVEIGKFSAENNEILMKYECEFINQTSAKNNQWAKGNQ